MNAAVTARTPPPPDDVAIRVATPDDAAAVAAIYAHYVRDTAITFEEAVPTAAEMRGRIAAVLARFPYLVAVADGAVIGYAYARPYAERASYRWSAEVAIYLDAAHRRRGVGRRLYAALLPILAQLGYVTAVAGVTLPNPASVRLHESFGFRPAGVFPRVGYKLGEWRDVGWWSLQLTDLPPGNPPEPIPWPAFAGAIPSPLRREG